MPGEEAEQQIEQTRADRKPCCLKMEIAAPAVLIREHVPIAGGHGIPGGWQVQLEPRAHVYVAGLTPVKPWMRKQISPPLTSSARNAIVVIQWVTRASAEWRSPGAPQALLKNQAWPKKVIGAHRDQRSADSHS